MNRNPSRRDWFFPIDEAPVLSTVTQKGVAQNVPVPHSRPRKLLQALVGVPGNQFKKQRGAFIPKFQARLRQDLKDGIDWNPCKRGRSPCEKCNGFRTIVVARPVGMPLASGHVHHSGRSISCVQSSGVQPATPKGHCSPRKKVRGSGRKFSILDQDPPRICPAPGGAFRVP
jgi:hypothetical protein